MRPSETNAGRAWIQRFDEVDHFAARTLIDSLEIRDHVQLEHQIKDRLDRLTHGTSPIVLVPVRGRKELAKVPTGKDHVAYEDFHPGDQFTVDIGSEGMIGGLIRDLVDSSPDRFMSPTTSLAEIRDLKIRRLVLVTDYVGTGDQALYFLRAFKSNRTVASWLSSGYLELSILSYAASAQASKKLRAEKYVSFQTCVYARSADAAGWSKETRRQIEDFCAKFSSDGGVGLGYRDNFGLYLTNTRVPNNLPDVLIRYAGCPPALFPGRQINHQLVSELVNREYLAPSDAVTILNNAGYQAIAHRLSANRQNLRTSRVHAALAMLEATADPDLVFSTLGSSEGESQRLKSSLVGLGFVDLEGSLTQAGRSELERASRFIGATRRYTHVRRSIMEYFPTRLR